MNDYANDRHWSDICEAILKERDPAQLLRLAKMLNEELERREDRIRNIRKTDARIGPKESRLL